MDRIVAHTRSFVIGVDTHARTHTYAVLAVNGEHLGTETFPNSHAGRARAIAWAARRTGGDLGALWVIEGVGSYGAQIARQATLAGYQVAEAARMGRAGRRGVGKSDPIDARRIANASGVGLDLDSEALGLSRHPEALEGGEAHALLATFPPEVAAAGLPGGYRQIGRVVAGAGVSVDGVAHAGLGGWDPYADGAAASR